MRTKAGRPAGPWVAALCWLAFLWLAGPRPAAAEILAADGGVRFTYTNEAAGSVFWAGEFNGWSTTATPFTREGDVWSVVIPLPAGEHQYKLVVDGAWVADPDNPETKGEFGNSLVRVGADGKPSVGSSAAPSGISAMNPKIRLGGRLISLFQADRDPAQDDRFELTRPDFDFDLDFNIKMSEVLDGRILTNIRSEREDTPIWQTRLNFDRGHLHLHSDKIDLYAYDNDVVPTWDDPLHLVGNVGIYGHDYGYYQQGMLAKKRLAGIDFELLYSDNFRTGGTTGPAAPPPDYEVFLAQQLARRQETLAAYVFSDTDNNKDALALNAGRELGKGWTAGLNARLDRGQNPGLADVSTVEYDPGAPDSLLAISKVVRYAGPTLERWNGIGGDLAWKTGDWTLRGEYLWGRNYLNFEPGTTATESTIADGDTTSRELSRDEIGAVPIATDDRIYLGGTGKGLGLDLDLSWTWHGTDITPVGNDSARYLDNRMMAWELAGAREFALSDDRTLKARLGVGWYDFDYDAGSPWKNQFWFDNRNYWLEAGEHLVTVDRMVLLGGNDVLSWKPSVSIDLLADPGLTFRYAGTINGVSLDSRPKYIESLFQATLQLTGKTKIYSDTRWVKYDDPVLDIGHGYVSTFMEVSYAFTPSMTFAFSFGVDPYVIDEPVNEYAYIGRDYFLFAGSATGAQAAQDYYSLATHIPAAEKALEDERRIQLEAIVRF